MTSSNSATPTTATNNTSSTCTGTSGCSIPTTTTLTTWMPKASGRAPATPMKSPTAGRATVTASPVMRSITATSIRTSPKACGACGGYTTCLKKAPDSRCPSRATTVITANLMHCAAVNQPLAPGPCPMARSLPARRFQRSCRCRAKPWRRCRARSWSCRKSARPWWLAMMMKTATVSITVGPRPLAPWRWLTAATPTATPTAA
ncbi:hypothetical protein D3C84_652580 [compost metagenome]